MGGGGVKHVNTEDVVRHTEILSNKLFLGRDQC